MLSDEQLMRYSRQILMPEFDIAGQERMRSGTVLVAGLGGLGSPVALYLAAAGVGRLLLADGDDVELSNLQRQIAHGEADIGVNKAQSAAASVTALNSEVGVEVVAQQLNPSNMSELVERADVVVDATDNYPARFALNRACIEAAVPLVSAAAVRGEGQLSVFDPVRGGPCYRCLYPVQGNDTALSCSESGVLAPLVGVLGSLQAMETLKILSGYGEPLRSRLLLVDLHGVDIRTLELPAWPECPDCGHLQT
ncbi:MAG: molybdopterin-synthase adenylyltransferase MoeB [Halieaceae bacterium]|nr:molybdopterin-synthase adenylyltransferase MoeB [Halieaceae bacterium]